MGHNAEKSAKALTTLLVFLLLVSLAVYLGIYGLPSIFGTLSGLSPADLLMVAVALFFVYAAATSQFFIILNDYERIVLFTLGKYSGVKGPGFVVVIPFIHTFEKVDMRTKTYDLPKQDVITRDNIEAKVDTVLYLTVKKADAAILNVEDYEEAAKLAVTSGLRDEIGKLESNEVIGNIDLINHNLTDEIAKIGKDWGVEAKVELKDVDLPESLIKAMHAAQAAKKEKEAMVTRAEGKKLEIEKIREATRDMTNENIVYYYFQALEKLAEGKSSKLVVPMELTKIGDFFSGSIKSGREQRQVQELIEKYADLIKDATKGDAPKEVQKAIAEEGAPRAAEGAEGSKHSKEEASKKADKLFEHHYNALKRKKTSGKK